MIFDLKEDFLILSKLNLLNYQDVYGVKKAMSESEQGALGCGCFRGRFEEGAVFKGLWVHIYTYTYTHRHAYVHLCVSMCTST